MKTINNLILKLKEGKEMNNVFHNEEYMFFIIKLVSEDGIKEIYTDIPSGIDVDLKVISVKENKVLVEDENGNQEWFIFINEEGTSRLYLSELKNNVSNPLNKAGNYDVSLENIDIINNFEFVRACV